mgnify:CR=1 FL=1
MRYLGSDMAPKQRGIFYEAVFILFLRRKVASR